ncbi:MAG: MFS transporter [Actinomycetes bacterium]
MTSTAAVPTVDTSDPKRWLSLVGICAVTALVWVTASDISIALPTIGRDIGGSADALQWAVNGYFLAGSLIIVTGRLGDVFGRLRLFTIGTALLIVGSVVAGLAGAPPQLVIGRVIEGVGAAAILPNALAMIAVGFAGRERDTAIGAWVATCWGAQAVGPLVGGALIASVGWASIFWINLPIGLIAIVLTLKATTESSDAVGGRHVDIPGAVALTGGITALSYGLVICDTAGSSQLIATFAAAVVLLILFVIIEMRSKVPLVKLTIFKHRGFDGAVLANLLANFVFGAAIYFMSLYLQVVLGYSPLKAGAMLLPATVPILLMTPFGARLGRRYGPGLPVTISMVMIAASAFLFTTLTGNYSDLLPSFILLGVGVGLQITMTAKVAVDDAGEAGEGVASGVYKASSMIGGSLGVATLTAVFQNSADSKFSETLDSLKPGAALIAKLLNVLTGSVTEETGQNLLNGQATLGHFAEVKIAPLLTTVFDYSLANAMWVGAAVSLLGALACMLLLRGVRADTPT